MIVDLIEEAVTRGVRRTRACAVVGVSKSKGSESFNDSDPFDSFDSIAVRRTTVGCLTVVF